MKKYLGIMVLPVAVGFVVLALITVCIRGCGSDASVSHGEDIVASSVCGTMFAVDDTATRADFQLLLQRTREACKGEQLGTETSYTNEDGSLKHVVIIGDEDTVRQKGSEYDVCVINWELDQVTAFKAFEEVCLNRRW